MTFTPVTNDPFEHYFYKRAQLADEMVTSGSFIDAYTLATASLDALAEIWFSDFPDVKRKLNSEFGGTAPSSIRLARFLKEFVSNDIRVSKVAVICFAEDWKYYRPQDTHLADQLLSRRLSNSSNEFLRSSGLPKSYLDVSRDALAQECPTLTTRPDIFGLLEEYEYGSLLYTFYRCPLVHLATGSRRTHGFAREEDVMYYGASSNENRITISFGPNLITCWLRNVVSGYVQRCQKEGIIPAGNLDAGTHEERFKRCWNRLN